MNEEAKRRIAEAMENKSTELHLSGCELTEIPDAIEEMVWLEELYLKDNQISEIENLEKLTNLVTLSLNNNQISEIENLEKLTNLVTLSLNNNQISEIKNLEKLTNLVTLSLNNNQISEIKNLEKLIHVAFLYLMTNQISKIENLEKLTNLISLSLDDNEISEIKNLEKLTNLREVYLINNRISELKNLEKLNSLKALILDNNRISEIKNLEKLTNLTSLSLGHNQISEIENLEKLTQIVFLYLNNNQIKKIKNLEKLKKLKYLHLGNNPISDIKPLKNLPKLKKLTLDNTLINELPNFLLNLELPLEWKESSIEGGILIKDCNHLIKPPTEFAAIGNDLIRAYFDAITEQSEVALNEVKVLLIGDGGSGKTSLAYRLCKPSEPLPTEEGRTRGIDVFDWKFKKEKTNYVAHLWDFGGQVMYDMVHQYFYSQRSLYILLDSSRSGANEHDSRLNQLLLSAELFGRGSTMIMVQNQHSDHTKKIDTAVLKTNYGFIKEFPTVNLQSKDGLKTLKNMLKDYIQKIPGMGAVMPTKWMAVRKAIDKRAKKTSTIRLDEYRQICNYCGISDEKAQDVLSRYLHQLGVFLHFQENTTKSLYKLIILNREWATKASYAVFDAEVVEKNMPKGSFSTSDLSQIWQDKAYKDYHAELLDLMGEFEICFQLESTGKYLIPRMMDKMPDDAYCDSAERPLHFYYQYTFMPEGLLNRLSVRLHDMIGGKDKDRVWNNGVVFEDKGLTAEVREIRRPDIGSRIDIKITGKEAHFMSETLLRAINKINDLFNFERLKVTINIPCICTKCKNSDSPHTYDFEEVKADLQKEDTKYHFFWCPKSRERVDYHDLLKTISHEALKEVEEAQKRNKVGKFSEGKGMLEGMMDDVRELKDNIKNEGQKTRITVKKEHYKTREILKEIPDIFRKDLDESQRTILAKLLESTQELEAENEDIKDLIEMVGRGIDELFYKHPTKEDLLKAFQQVRVNEADESADFKHKLKASLWLIPTILKYEGEFSTNDIIGYFKERWRAGGFKRLFLK